MPDSYRSSGNYKFRLDVVLHDRDEKLNPVNFIDQCRKQTADLAFAETIVLWPFGRGCNAFKFAGEIDVQEAIDAVKRQYHIDDDRISVHGFGMGGAGCWQLAVHFPDLWMVDVPAASFVDTPQFTSLSEDALSALPEWQRKLFHLYDSPDWDDNLYHCATIAYSNQDPAQIQSAEIMEKALQTDGLAIRRILGSGHRSFVRSAIEIRRSSRPSAASPNPAAAIVTPTRCTSSPTRSATTAWVGSRSMESRNIGRNRTSRRKSPPQENWSLRQRT